MPGNAKKKCPKKAGNLVVQVRRQNMKNPKKWDKLSNKCALELTPDVDKPKDNIRNRTTFKNLCEGAYSLKLTPQREEAVCDTVEIVDGSEKGQIAEGEDGTLLTTVDIRKNETTRHLYRFYPHELRVQVEEARTGKKLQGITVVAEGDPSLKASRKTTDKQGLADFGIVRSGSEFNLKVSLSQKDAGQYLVEDSYGKAKAKRLKHDPFPIKLARKKVHLQLHYTDPEGASHPFPKDFAFSIVFDDGTRPANPGSPKVLDDKGNFDFEVESGKRWFTLQFDSAKVRYLVHKKNPSGNGWVPDDSPVLEDPTDDRLRQLTLDGKRFFSLPKKWSLATSQWATEKVTLPADGHIGLPLNGCTSKDTAGKLTVKPSLLHVRFEYQDRRYGHSDHSDKRVSIPPVVLKGWHNDRFASPPDHGNPPADPDAVSNWSLPGADPDKACKCQMLPWIATKKDDGSDRKFDSKMLLEFGWPDGFVCSQSAKERKIEKIATGDAKRKPGVDRPKYYDLPHAWKSANYYTRLPGNKGKFFDELTEVEIKAAFDPAKPLAFSLDDIVLVDDSGNQMDKGTMDKTDADVAKALSADSRIAMLDLDPAASFKVRVYEPRTDPADKAPYWSKSDYSFWKDDAGTYRNVIVKYSQYARVVVFCSGFHDIYDKRTTAADFTKKQVLGARAAKLNDAHVHVTESIQADANAFGDYTAANCGNFDLHFLQYAGIDIAHKQMLFALVTYWNCRLTADTGRAVAKRGNATDVKHYREEGMANAMGRWNAKDYEFVVTKQTVVDGKAVVTNRTDVKGKSFSLFEAKLDGVGGQVKCAVSLNNDDDDGMGRTFANLSRDAYKLQPTYYSDPAEKDYDGKTYETLTVAHELGHASGLKDSYIYHLNSWRGIARYQQYYPGMPYVIDNASIMRQNQAPRLRMYWGKVSWVHNKLPVPDLAATDRLEVVYPGKKDLTYSRPAGETLKDIYKPQKREGDFEWGVQDAKCDMLLYRLGQDEFAHSITKGQTYNGILLVTTRIHVEFSGAWAPNADQLWLRSLINNEVNVLSKTFHLKRTNGKGDFDNTFVRFFWQFADTNPVSLPDGAGGHINVSRHFKLTVNHLGDEFTTNPGNKTMLTVGKDCDLKRIVAYFLGIDNWAFVPIIGWIRGLIWDYIEPDDLKKLGGWMKTQLNGIGFTVKKLK